MYSNWHICCKCGTLWLACIISTQLQLVPCAKQTTFLVTVRYRVTAEPSLLRNHLMQFFPLVNNLSTWTSSPECLSVRCRRDWTERDWATTWAGWGGGAGQRSVGWNVSSGESCSWGFSLSAQWCPLYRADTIWPAGMLLSRGWRGLLCCRGDGLWLRDVLTVVVLTI